MLPQALFMFCWAAECPPFGAILPRLFISDSISSALLLLKGGEALLCPAACALWFIGARCRPWAPLLSDRLWRMALSLCELNSSGARSVCVCANFPRSPPFPNTHTNERAMQSMCLIQPQITSMRTHAETPEHAWWKVWVRTYVGECIRCKTNYHCWWNNQLCKLQPSRNTWFIVHRIHKF